VSTSQQTDIYLAKMRKTAKMYLIFTCFMIFFGFVYEIFGRGVWSFYMVYAFVIPFALGYLPFNRIARKKNPRMRSTLCRWFWHAGVGTLTVGSVMFGVMEIYGSGSNLVYVYPAVGAILIVVSVILSFRKVD